MTERTRPNDKLAVVSVRTSERLRTAFETTAEAHAMTTADVLRGLMAEWVSNPRPVSAFMPATMAT
ncbi:hypothetical protein PCE31106_00106 [Pandoraea cepalis]|jgi:hypothetical protein|uniref:Uncharacterized protein n=1 Tax=Pandoraea cepalis TaxID=2508294 RepID=A0A5E4REH6_9BURK|nr:hypothetical protein [Pandoraea cepalis]VVD61211.1 hypothetical protein PCE31106_00106 [Pandoraea cepalis]